MFTKNSDIFIDKNDPYKFDTLERKKDIEDLTNVLLSTKQPFVVSIEAPWGYGKTTFLKLWKVHLENNGYDCVMFNAWENDFVPDPLIPFITQMGEVIKSKKNGTDKIDLEETYEKIKKTGKVVIRKSIPVLLRLLSQGIIDDKVISNIKIPSSEIGPVLEDIASDQINIYEKEKNGLGEFRKLLQKFAIQLAQGKEGNHPFIFFIDELDRCRPDFCISLLERIKHIFSVENVVFVLAIDIKQLICSIKHLYGDEIDTDGYLRRFIDLHIGLPIVSNKNFIDSLFKLYGIDDYFQTRHQEKYNFPPYEFDNLRNAFIELADNYNISLRAQEQYLSQLNLILRVIGPQNFIYPELLCFFVFLKNTDPTLYNKIIPGEIKLKPILDSIKEQLANNKFCREDLEPFIYNQFLTEYSDNQEVKSIIADFEKEMQSIGDDAKDIRKTKRVERIIWIRNSLIERNGHVIHTVINRINNIGRYLK